MTDYTHRQRLSTSIERAQAEVARLLALVKQDPLKQQLRLATRDLDEALTWLNQENVDTRPTILQIAELAFSLATGRLALVKHAVDTFGPDATLSG